MAIESNLEAGGCPGGNFQRGAGTPRQKTTRSGILKIDRTRRGSASEGYGKSTISRLASELLMYWIDTHGPGRLGIAARPRSGDWLREEIEGWRKASFDIVISLLEPRETHELQLEREREVCAEAGVGLISFPIPDRDVPASLTKTREVIACKDRLNAGDGILIHCRAGIGRSSLIAACLLLASGQIPSDALDRITKARGIPVPDTQAQAQWVAAFVMA